VLLVSRLLESHSGPVLCYVTDRHSLPQNDPAAAGQRLLRKMKEVAAAGVDWIQIREKDLAGKDCACLTREALQTTARPSPKKSIPTRFFVNDRLDVALSERTGGVHLGESSLPVAEARRLTNIRARGADFLIGVSCHSREAAISAESGGADYIFFGPVFATPSKAAYGQPQGLTRLAEVCRASSLPVLAIGGINLENARSCLSAGAWGIAAVRLFQDAQDPASLVSTLRT
jgi:thiamine-phosphate pyrophosphorylase